MPDNLSKEKNWFSNKRLGFLLAAALILPFFISRLNPTLPVKVHASLLATAVNQPEKKVAVIVQKANQDGKAEALVAELGGVVTKDLRIINAFAAELPAKAAIELAKESSVDWISLDAPMIQDSGVNDPPKISLQTDFDQGTFGEEPTISWLELGEEDGPETGDVVVTSFLGGTFQGPRIQGTGNGIQSSFDLTDAQNAMLSFGYRRKGFESASDYIAIELSNNGGVNWTEIDRLTGPATDPDLISNSYDLTPFINGEFLLRFVSSANMQSESKFYIDFIQIEYQYADSPRKTPDFSHQVMLPIVFSSGESVENSPSLDIPTYASDTERIQDSFNSVSYNNNDGTTNWKDSWVEFDPDGGQGPIGGYVFIKNGRLTFNYAYYEYVIRHVDLSGYTNATLSFDWQTSGLDTSEYISVLISKDGYEPFVTLDALTGSQTGSSKFDISKYISSNTAIKFGNIGTYWNYGENAYIDNVNISISTDTDQRSPFLEREGEVVIEAENYHNQTVGSLGDTWQVTTDFNNYSGETSLHALPNDGTNTGLDTTGPELQYEVAFTNAGTYYVFIRGLAPNNNTSDDTLHIGLNGISVTEQGYGASGFEEYFSWHSYNNGEMITVQIPTPGIYTLNVWMREDGMVLDKLWLTTEPDVVNVDDTILGPPESPHCSDCINTSNLTSTYIQAIGADQLWNESSTLQGQGITVAVVDSGITNHNDLHDPISENSRIVIQHHYDSTNLTTPDDYYGHGTHVAGIIGGNGVQSDGGYMGVAPKVNLIDVKVMDDFGAGLMSDVIEGLGWIFDHKDQYNIRVVNLSLNSAEAESYHTSPLDAALEILWFNNIVVVVSAGNNGASNDSGVLYPPANDPFVITVGAADDMGTADISNDVLSSFSAYGITEHGFAKPDLVAPGSNIISLLASDDCNLVIDHPSHAVPGPDGTYYFRMSGTSMSSGVVAGAAALLLQDEPQLTPDQVKYRLMATTKPFTGPEAGSAGAGYLDIFAAVHGTTTESSNIGIEASQLLWSGDDPIQWGSVNWGSVNWGSVNWGSVNWGSVNWGSVNWGSVNWDD